MYKITNTRSFENFESLRTHAHAFQGSSGLLSEQKEKYV